MKGQKRLGRNLPVRDVAEREIRQIYRDEFALERDEVDGRTEPGTMEPRGAVETRKANKASRIEAEQRIQMSPHKVADIGKIQHLHRRGT